MMYLKETQRESSSYALSSSILLPCFPSDTRRKGRRFAVPCAMMPKNKYADTHAHMRTMCFTQWSFVPNTGRRTGRRKHQVLQYTIQLQQKGIPLYQTVLACSTLHIAESRCFATFRSSLPPRITLTLSPQATPHPPNLGVYIGVFFFSTVGVLHVTVNGTRLEMRTFELLLVFDVVCDLRGDHKLRGV